MHLTVVQTTHLPIYSTYSASPDSSGISTDLNSSNQDPLKLHALHIQAMTEAMSAAMARASFSPLTGDAATGIRSSPGNSFFLQTMGAANLVVEQ